MKQIQGESTGELGNLGKMKTVVDRAKKDVQAFKANDPNLHQKIVDYVKELNELFSKLIISGNRRVGVVAKTSSKGDELHGHHEPEGQ